MGSSVLRRPLQPSGPLRTRGPSADSTRTSPAPFSMATSVGNVADSTGTVACHAGTGALGASSAAAAALRRLGPALARASHGGLHPPGRCLARPERGAACQPGPLPAELSRSGGLDEAVAPGAAPAAFVLVSPCLGAPTGCLGLPTGRGLSFGGLLSALPGRSLQGAPGGSRRD